MTKQAIIERTINSINSLPEEKAIEISDFAEFVFKRYEENVLTNGIRHLMSESKPFSLLQDEEELYSEKDLKEVYRG